MHYIKNEALLCKTLGDNTDPIRETTKYTYVHYTLAMTMTTVNYYISVCVCARVRACVCVEDDVQGIKINECTSKS